MAIAAEDLELIKDQFTEWLAEQRPFAAPQPPMDRELFERVVRVEEELKHQRELMQQGFAAMERRFEQVEKRFEQVDKRLDQMDKRLDQMDKRLDQVDNHLDQMDKRLDQIDKRFEQVDRRFEAITRRIDRFMFWSFGLTASSTAIILAVLRFWMTSP
jgi:septal ring factor EnvC (AmiA/AmiB activator)